MQVCPRCGRYMNNHVEPDRLNNFILVYNCQCGYNTKTDRSGLRYSNVSDRYFSGHYVSYNKTYKY